MPFILAALGAIAAIFFYVQRARNAAEMVNELGDVAGDVRSAIRRLGLSFRKKGHPADDLESPAVAVAGIGEAFLGLDDLPTKEQRDALLRYVQSEMDVPYDEAESAVIVGRWVAGQCGTNPQAIARLTRTLKKMSGPQALQPLMGVLNGVAGAGSGALNDQQRDALQDIARKFGV